MLNWQEVVGIFADSVCYDNFNLSPSALVGGWSFEKPMLFYSMAPCLRTDISRNADWTLLLWSWWRKSGRNHNTPVWTNALYWSTLWEDDSWHVDWPCLHTVCPQGNATTGKNIVKSLRMTNGWHMQTKRFQWFDNQEVWHKVKEACKILKYPEPSFAYKVYFEMLFNLLWFTLSKMYTET